MSTQVLDVEIGMVGGFWGAGGIYHGHWIAPDEEDAVTHAHPLGDKAHDHPEETWYIPTPSTIAARLRRVTKESEA